ncbi:MAG: hypothetical protein Q8L34_04050, partial [Candidatus Woesearchaeota archaeon]|nr:hypothetical protein [Candidatus Woesearchaeota archaeon]
MATPLADVINYLRTNGGTGFERVTYADQDDIVLSFGDNLTTRQANFIKAAFLTWGDLIDIPVAFGNSDVNITVTYGTNVPAGAVGVTRTSPFFSVDHHTDIV